MVQYEHDGEPDAPMVKSQVVLEAEARLRAQGHCDKGKGKDKGLREGKSKKGSGKDKVKGTEADEEAEEAEEALSSDTGCCFVTLDELSSDTGCCFETRSSGRGKSKEGSGKDKVKSIDKGADKVKGSGRGKSKGSGKDKVKGKGRGKAGKRSGTASGQGWQ